MTEKEQLDAEMTEVLKHLPGWQLDPKYADHSWCAALIDGTGRGIHVNATQAKGRFYLGGMWPTDSDHRQYIPNPCPHITIARDRPPEKIAADIQRRFLPQYTTAYAEQAERATKHNDGRRRQQEVTMELAALLGPEASRRLQSNPNQIYAPGLTVVVHNNGESVSILLRYKSATVAKAVLRSIVKAGGLDN
jgi:hypothetical protein